MEDLGGHVFGRIVIADAAGDERIHLFEMPFVQIGKPRRVSLRRFDEKALVGVRHGSAEY